VIPLQKLKLIIPCNQATCASEDAKSMCHGRYRLDVLSEVQCQVALSKLKATVR